MACTGDDHHADVVVRADLPQAVPERDHDVERHRIHPFRSVQGDQGDVGLGRGDLYE
jgi:hypothetical protein